MMIPCQKKDLQTYISISYGPSRVVIHYDGGTTLVATFQRHAKSLFVQDHQDLNMPSHQQPSLSRGEQVHLVLRLALTALSFAWNNVRYGWPLFIARWPLKRALFVNFLRSSKLTLRELHATSPTSGEALKAYCTERGLECVSSSISCGSKCPSLTLHEIMPKSTSNNTILLYLHGGGYAFPIMGAAQPDFALTCAGAAKAKAVFMMEYTLAPELRYPGQLRQAVASLDYLINDRHFQPDQIIIGGDSAGANLAFGLLAHIKQPHPEIPTVDYLNSGKLKAAFLMSPWVTTTCSSVSFDINKSKDHMVRSKVAMFLDSWRPKIEVWADQLIAEESFWRDLPVKRLILSAGTWETFYDDICQMAGILSRQNMNVDFIEGRGEVHCQGLIDTAAGLPPTGSLAKVIDLMESM